MATVTVEHINTGIQSGWDDRHGFWGDPAVTAHARLVHLFGLPVRHGCGTVEPEPGTPQAALLGLVDGCSGRGRIVHTDITVDEPPASQV